MTGGIFLPFLACLVSSSSALSPAEFYCWMAVAGLCRSPSISTILVRILTAYVEPSPTFGRSLFTAVVDDAGNHLILNSIMSWRRKDFAVQRMRGLSWLLWL